MSRPRSARDVALRVLLRVFEDDAYADRAFRSEAAGLDDRDAAFAMQLAYGTIQRVRTLDHGIEALGRRPVRKLDPPVRAALRLGAYQLAYAGSVPVHAAVNETVELVRRARLERAVPFANAVMRRLTIGLADVIAGLADDTPGGAALAHSYPDWVAERWFAELGADEARALMVAQNEPAETVVRLNERRPAAVPGEPVPDLPGALRVERVDAAWVEQGLVWPQSRASQLVGRCVGSRPGERTLDLCAAPGGKTTMLAGEVVAVEADEGRARELEQTVARQGATGVRVVRADGRALPPGLVGFDRALVDAPCSGLGVLAARPDMRWRATPLPELQTELLRSAVARVRPGGVVVYAVCTVNREENEAVVDAVGLPLDDLGAEWPAYRHPRRPELLLTLPHRHGTAGFFVARLRVP
ncbi:MAG: transcription antitermination factor NusB [Thermoleophilia bacterium]